jgi:16S rRNA (guanine(966)-N(2))-methyltransferase RsmD
LRPTADRAREALFNIIGDRIEGAAFLDLFAGTGAVGFEALSRGADRVVMVEERFIDLIAKNAAKLKIGVDPARFHPIRGDFRTACETMKRREERFDIVFADPPWRGGFEEATLVNAAPLLADGGSAILECWVKVDPPPSTAGLAAVDTRRYGDTKFVFYRKA